MTEDEESKQGYPLARTGPDQPTLKWKVGTVDDDAHGIYVTCSDGESFTLTLSDLRWLKRFITVRREAEERHW